LDKDKACLEDLHEVIAIRIPDGTKNKEIDKIGSDHWMLKWIIGHIHSEKTIIDPEEVKEQIRNTIILSPTLNKKINFNNAQLFHQNNQKIYFENPLGEIDIRYIQRKLTEEEIYLYTIHVMLNGTFDRYPGFDAIISEDLYSKLTKRNGVFDPNKSYFRFFLKPKEGQFTSQDLKDIEMWAYEQFGKGAIIKEDSFFRTNKIRINFTSDAKQWTSSYNIISKLKKLDSIYSFDTINKESSSNNFFYVKKDDIFSKDDIKKIQSWADKYFGKGAIKDIPEPVKKEMIKIEFTSDAQKWTSKHTISKKFTKLKKYKQFSLDFKFEEDSPTDNNSPQYFEAFIYINQNNYILDNIPKLYHYIGKKYSLYLEANQLMTLSNYRKYLQRIDAFFYYVLTGFSLLVLIYILVTFSLLLQTKRHQIGIFKAMGGSSIHLIFIYVFESLLLISFPIFMALLISYYFPPYEIYAANWTYVIFYICFIVFLTIIGAGISAWNIVTKSPYQLIHYQT